MMHSLIFGGVDSAFFNVYISGGGTFSAPQRDVEVVSIPGRNGDLIIDNGRWRNIEVRYPAFIPSGFKSNIDAFRAAICRKTGYQRLEDTYHPDEYRMAMLSAGVDPSTKYMNQSASMDLVFNCKPQRFLKIGDEPIQILTPFVSTGSINSNYIQSFEDGKLDFEVHCVPTDTLTVVVKEYDQSGTEVDSTSFTCSDGDSESVDTTEDYYYRILVSGISYASYIDETYIKVQMIAKYNNDPIELNAVLARTWRLTNPTGYYAKPMIELFSTYVPRFSITNYIGDYLNGVQESYYAFYSTVTSADHIFLDCDLQYMYDENKTNLTNYLTLTDAVSDIGEGLVFPQLGEDEIELYIYSTGIADIDNGMGLIMLYPRWWKL